MTETNQYWFLPMLETVLNMQTPAMVKQCRQSKISNVEENTRIITTLRSIYFLQILFKWMTVGISISRPFLFLISILVNVAAIKVVQDMPQYAHYLGPVTVLSFASFIFNPGNVYTTSEDHCLLMFGYVSLTYISAAFQNLDLQTTCHYIAFSNVLVWLYFTEQFQYSRSSLFFTMIVHLFSVFLIALNYEIREKSEFMEREKLDRMHKDIVAILDAVSEGVIITTKEAKAKIVMSNTQARRLLVPEVTVFDSDEIDKAAD